MELIIADSAGLELGSLDANKEIDMDIGETNDYTMTMALSDWTALGYDLGCRMYIPDTEYGGLIQNMEISVATDTVILSGDTWRGMLVKKIIEPSPGLAYRTVSGDANRIIEGLLTGSFGSLFAVPETDSGILIEDYSFDRYTDLLSGLAKMLYTAGARLRIRYDRGPSRGAGYVEICATPIVDYSDTEEYSEDSNISFLTADVRNGINHLICLGKGELQAREVLHLYVQSDGSIGSSQYYTGPDERVAVYDYGNAESLAELMKGGKERLRELQDYLQFDMTIDDIVAEIGDIVGGREYTTGFLIQQQITQKVITMSNDELKIEYKVGGSVKTAQVIGGGNATGGGGGAVEALTNQEIEDLLG